MSRVFRLTRADDVEHYPAEIKERILDRSYSITFTVGDVVKAVVAYIIEDHTVSFELQGKLSLSELYCLIRYMRGMIKRVQDFSRKDLIAWVDMRNDLDVKFVEFFGFKFDSKQIPYGRFIKEVVNG